MEVILNSPQFKQNGIRHLISESIYNLLDD